MPLPVWQSRADGPERFINGRLQGSNSRTSCPLKRSVLHVDYSQHLVVGRISDNASASHAETNGVLSVSHPLRFASSFFGALIPRLRYFQ